jgi:hypothetical protein
VGDETQAEATTTEGFTLRGYDTPKGLADGLTGHWTEAVAALADGSLERHARGTLNDPQLADEVAEIAKDKSVSEDTRLFRVIMRLDPREDAEFMGYEVSEAGLGELGTEVDGPFPTWSATAALRIMYTDHVLTLYADATKASRFRELDGRWHDEFETWGGLVGRSRDAGGIDVFADNAWRTRAKILRGLLDTKDEEPLRAKAREAAKRPTVADWTRDVGPLDTAGIGALMAASDLEPAADAYDEARRSERKAEKSRRRRGVAGGVVVVGLLVGVVVGIIAFTNTNPSVGLDTTSPSPTATVATSIDPSTAAVIGTEIVQNPTPLLETPDDGATVIQQLAKQDRLYKLSPDTHGFYLVKLSTDDKVVGWVKKNDVAEICPVQC